MRNITYMLVMEYYFFLHSFSGTTTIVTNWDNSVRPVDDFNLISPHWCIKF